MMKMLTKAILLAAAASMVAALGHNETAAPTMTRVVTAFTTYCPEPTTVPIGRNRTITVTRATMLTVTDCPCTIVETCHGCVMPLRTASATYHAASTTEQPSSETEKTHRPGDKPTGRPVTPPSQAPPAASMTGDGQGVRACPGMMLAVVGAVGYMAL
ncbi:hypothetical protein CDD81_5201 [Ophiocordyceps australis]|uniref:Clock-controlled protein 6 n=1 Tax=Ophiocordyceps australis TaxID=1399860 RepID=A0A2C5XDH3_9HYPO|nr:hypothetical protein CDD81_5201 [Ophiocordyceps australis]